MLAVDLVESFLKDKTSVLIIFSGDADFIPALELVKGNNGKVLSVSLAKGYSRELREKFEFFAIGRINILENCLK